MLEMSNIGTVILTLRASSKAEGTPQSATNDDFPYILLFNAGILGISVILLLCN